MPTYHVISSRNFLKRAWGGECVVFFPDSRETHLLSEPCAFVLNLLELGVVSAEKLHEELGLAMEEADDLQVVSLLREILYTLIKIGLIEMHEDVV